jgi:hypothetical protein
VRLGDLREKKETSSRKKVNAVVCFCIEIQWTTALIFDEQVLPCPTQRAKLDALLYNNPLEYSKGLLYSSASSFARCVGHGSTCSSKINAVVHCISIQKQTTALTFLRDEVSFFSLKSPNRTTLHHRH